MPKTTYPELNEQLLLDVLWRIKEQPEHWVQGGWLSRDNAECGTTGCIAGHAIDLSKDFTVQWAKETFFDGDEWWDFSIYDDRGFQVDVEDAGRRALGLTAAEAEQLFFSMTNNVDTMERLIKSIIAGDYRTGAYDG